MSTPNNSPNSVEIIAQAKAGREGVELHMLTVRHSETQSPTLMRPTTPGGEIRCPQKNETGYFECPRLHNSAETIPEP